MLIALVMSGCGSLSAEVQSTDGERRFVVDVELATSEDERRRGLTGRTLSTNEGLLLVFPAEGEVCIQNGGVPFDLAALHFDENDRVVALERFDAGDAIARCHLATRRVLEVQSAIADAVQIGDVGILP